jgi:hypothetical protein
MFSTLAILIAVLVAAVLVSAAMKPGTFRVQRTRIIHAGPRKIVPLIEDFRAWRSWSPYEKLDPAMKKALSGAAKGKGAVYAWEGNARAGAGRMEITLEPRSGSTDVTWTMYGRSPYLARVATTFFSMDRLVGSQFETGLANLKAIAEG